MLYNTNFNRAAPNLIKQYGDSADLHAEEQFEKHCLAGDAKEVGWWMHNQALKKLWQNTLIARGVALRFRISPPLTFF